VATDNAATIPIKLNNNKIQTCPCKSYNLRSFQFFLGRLTVKANGFQGAAKLG